MQRTAGREHHQKFFFLRVAEITHGPERRRHLFPVYVVDARNSHASAQVFIGQRIKRVLNRRRMAVTGWIDVAAAKLGSSARLRLLRVHRKPNEIANRGRFHRK